MIHKWSRYAVLELFFDFPRKKWLVRELSRTARIATTSVRIHLNELLKDEIIIKERDGLYPSFSANRQNEYYKMLKKQNTVLRIYLTGIIHIIEKATYPKCVVLFGSASRGEDDETSDIDLFVQSKQVPVPLQQYEKKLKRTISLLFEPDIKELGAELINNIINGEVLYGYLKVK
ncbi:nucleotidyltransferase domain-containing protein [Candidatus Woesearchaeota archaeon]|nr:nucleotidyltransferase domain-containing protein [Candidatus Woesearchaeota archaeon]